MEKLITQDLKTLWNNISISFTWDYFQGEIIFCYNKIYLKSKMCDTGNHGHAVYQLLKQFVIIKENKNINLSGTRVKYCLWMNNINGAARTNKQLRWSPKQK